MNAKTRYLAIVSLVVLVAGVGAGLLGYYIGLPTSEAASRGGPDELQFVPSDASLVAYADVRDIMTSAFGEKARAAFTFREDARRAFASQTGINVETDIDSVVAAVMPSEDGAQRPPGFGLVVARGRFDAVKIEALVREHGGRVEDYKGRRLMTAEPPRGDQAFSLAFLDTGVAAIGTRRVVQAAVDLAGGGASLATNEEIMQRVRALDPGNAWIVGSIGAARAALPAGVGQPLRAMQWLSLSARIDGSIHGRIRAEAQEESAANDLRELIRGGMALARFQAGARPELAPFLQSLELGGAEKVVTLSFDLPLDLLGGLLPFLNAARPPVQAAR